MRFWRAGFAPRCAGDEFDKKYAYNVRYNYAREGKRTDYTPYSCLKIISTPVPKARAPARAWPAAPPASPAFALAVLPCTAAPRTRAVSHPARLHLLAVCCCRLWWSRAH
jgi:DNA primase large subunit